MAKTKTKNNGKYYNGEMVLSEAERINAGIIMVTSNRSDGKTTWFLKEAKRRFKEYGHQLMLVYRYKYELSAAAELFDGVQQLEGDETEFTCKSFAQGMIYKIYYGEEQFGFAVALSNPDVIKKYSALFSKVEWMLMDEYQSESGKYLPNEVEKLQSVYTSINRGGGYQSRDVKVILLGNMVSELNPYWIIPQSIVRRSIIPAHLGDTTYFNNRRFKIRFQRSSGNISLFRRAPGVHID